MLNILCNNNRYITVSLVHKLKTGNKIKDSDKIDALIDTGAVFTCFMADSFQNVRLKEEDFKDENTMELGGFITRADEGDLVSSLSARFYEYQVNTFTIGNINLKSQKIWITFDKRIEWNLIGMDMLSKIGLIQYPNSNILSIFENEDELNTYVINNSKIKILLDSNLPNKI